MKRIIAAFAFTLITAAFSGHVLAQQAATPLMLADNAPDKHVVVKGDTLWGIAASFLKDPWRWPEIWGLNRDQVKNPHRIYPGNVILLMRHGDDTPHLVVAQPLSTVRAEPRVHVEAGQQAIPAIPSRDIEPFLSEPLVVDQAQIEGAPRILAGPEGRVYAGRGDSVFAVGIDERTAKWQVFRPGNPLVDPDSGETLGHEALYLGSAEVAQAGNPARLTVTEARQEMGRGDRLVAAAPPTLAEYAPHAPDAAIDAKVMSVYGGQRMAGPKSIIVLNRGSRDGLRPGHVLALWREGREVASGKGEEKLRLPAERYGLVFVFRSFERVAYALVMDASRPVQLRDGARKP